MFIFTFLRNKIKYDFSVAMNYVYVNYEFSLLNFKMYRPNMITNDGYINRHQKLHRGYQVTFPKTILKLKKPQTKRNKQLTDEDV